MSHDLTFIVQWWAVLFCIGIIFLPLASRIFSGFWDFGYIFSKVLGVVFVSYLIFVLGFLHILPFNTSTTYVVLFVFALVNLWIFVRVLRKQKNLSSARDDFARQRLPILILEEFLFFLAILFWAYIRGHEPSLNSLEKFMDFGFVNSILRGEYFPPSDMWYAPLSINYYYFGHLATAVITRLSFISSAITYNLMIATIFAFCFLGAFSIGLRLFKKRNSTAVGLGLLSGFFVALSGNLHMLYAFFGSYSTDAAPAPIWSFFGNFPASIFTFPNSYWYPNATRFIEKTIHEFPIYSFVVSDLHGHVLSIPFVLFTLAVLLKIVVRRSINIWYALLLSFFVAVLYMTNAMDGVLYLGLSAIVFFVISCLRIEIKHSKKSHHYFIIETTISKIENVKSAAVSFLFYAAILVVGYFIFSLPFNSAFRPFVSGIGVLCTPVTQVTTFGPLLFEPDHCQRSPLWQLLILYGFFIFFTASLFVFYARAKKYVFQKHDLFVVIIALFSFVLLIVPEFVYAKDIYPDHYRANTMFKLAYQAFIMLSLVSAYSLVTIVRNTRNWIFIIVSIFLSTVVLLYPFFAVLSYYGELQTYRGLDGTRHFAQTRPEDLATIQYLNTSVVGQPVILEAQGDSYTDYGRLSANSGLPTVLGWTVHEWLWRGTYEIVAPRIDEIRVIYESGDPTQIVPLLNKYDVEYIYVGGLEREKYPRIQENVFSEIGYSVVFERGDSRLYKKAGSR